MGFQIGRVQVLRDIDFEFSVDRIFETPPFPSWTESKYPRDRLEEPVRRLRSDVQAEIDPRAMYRVLPTEQSDIGEYSPPDPLLEPEYICTLIVTVGPFESAAEQSTPIIDEIVRDALENAALGLAKERVATQIRERANRTGWNTTRLFSPGSGNVDWAVENSEFVFETLPASEIGVCLTENGLIVPNKSVSSVLGMGPAIDQAPNLFTCDGCPRIPDCPYALTGAAKPGEV